ncbi:MAG: EutN/CcmL family microcompartment protein [Kiritimatiellae bacterium]|nr:EutN/CcmL family microcompartment protein [Kiritimatiellia bacterium]MDD4735409.1 EutN/CcmL family microcompartment protein [Kiritimatiellia bacterium]
MMLGKVIGSITATIRHPFFNGQRMLSVELLDAHGKTLNDYVVAIDTVDAGPGDHVLLVDEGNSARQIIADKDAPLRTVIVGIVDAVETMPC